MSKIVRFPTRVESDGKPASRPSTTLTTTTLMASCSFHHLKASLMQLGQHPEFQTAADAIPVIDWATRELNGLIVPNEHNFKSLKMLADIINQVGTYVEHTCGYGCDDNGALDEPSST